MGHQDASLTKDFADPEAAGLTYPLRDQRPDPGALTPVADGVFWLRMPLPFSLNHINLYVLDDGDAWVLIDTGLDVRPVREAWETLFAGPLAGKPVSRIIVTHFHPDHLGLAGWLCERTGAPLLMARAEFLIARMLCAESAPEPPQTVLDFYARAGWPAADLEVMRRRGWGNFGKVVSPLPHSYTRLRHGDTLSIGGRDWHLVEGSGHSPEHICLMQPELKLLIAGDQVLPRITPNVSVHANEPRANPLGDWFDSMTRLEALPDDLLVLPAHNDLFFGLHRRLAGLRRDHERKLDALRAQCVEPSTVIECFHQLFRRKIDNSDIMMATGEALAHLHYLEAKGDIVRRKDADADRFIAA